MQLEGHKMTKLRFLFVVLCGVLMAPGLAVANENNGENESDTDNRRGFFVSQFRDFKAIDNRHVVLYGPSRKHGFLATMFGYCSGLRFADEMAIDSRLPFLSARQSAAIIIFTPHKQRCTIKTFEPVKDFAAAKALVKQRKELAAKK